MTAYLVETASLGTLKADRLVISAADLADAKAYAESLFGGEGGSWANATFTALADVASSDAAALLGWRFNVVVTTPAGAILEEVTYTAIADADTLDEIGDALVILLNLTTAIAGASYSSNVLTVAAIGDGIGDHTLNLNVYPPIVNDGGGVRENQDVAIAGYTGTIVDEGIAGAVLTVDFAADGYVRPTSYLRLNKGHVA